MEKKAKPIEALRQKYWCELTIKEKIERMRNILKRIMKEMDDLKITVDKMKKHKHDSEGLPIVEERLDIFYDKIIISNETEEKDKVYF